MYGGFDGKISSSHGGVYEVQNCLLGCTAVYIPEDNSELYGKVPPTLDLNPRRKTVINLTIQSLYHRKKS
jgi:hypothetical protein